MKTLHCGKIKFALWGNELFLTTATTMHRFSPQCTFPTMYHLCVCVFFLHNDQLGRTDFPHNVLFVHMCVFSPQWPIRRHRFSPQCTFPTVYHLYVCVCFPHNDQLGRTLAQIFPTKHFPHNVSFVRVYFAPQRPTRTHIFWTELVWRSGGLPDGKF